MNAGFAREDERQRIRWMLDEVRLADVHKVLLETHPIMQELLRARKERREQEEKDRQIKFLAFVGKVASFMQILATQIKDEVRQVRES